MGTPIGFVGRQAELRVLEERRGLIAFGFLTDVSFPAKGRW
jgi:hypothetical protein